MCENNVKYGVQLVNLLNKALTAVFIYQQFGINQVSTRDVAIVFGITMKEMERLTVPQPKYTIQAMDTPLVMDNDEDQRGLGYQNTLVSFLLKKTSKFFFYIYMGLQNSYIKHSRSRAQCNAAGDNYNYRCV